MFPKSILKLSKKIKTQDREKFKKDAFKFINGVLDELAISNRISEKTLISS